MKPPTLAFLFVLGLILAILGINWPRGETTDEQTPVATPIPAPEAPPTAAPTSPTTITRLPIAQSADDLTNHTLSPTNDLAILEALLQQYHRHHGGNPIGDNDDIIATLQGRNPKRLGYFPKEHPSLDPQGQLLDRWGTPYFFHALSGRETEIRSAGPDRELWSNDDVVRGP